MPPNTAPSPNRMSLRTTIKPPKRPTGDVVDNSIASIIGDRTLDSSEIVDSSSSPRGRTTERGSPSTTAFANRQATSRQTASRQASAFTGENSRIRTSSSTGLPTNQASTTTTNTATRAVSPKKTAPDTQTTNKQVTNKQMTKKASSRSQAPGTSVPGVPAVRFYKGPINRYIGPQTEFNPNLPPAAFPTLDTPEQREAYERELAEAAASKSSGAAPFDAPVSSTHAYDQSDTEDLAVTQEIFASSNIPSQEAQVGKGKGRETVNDDTQITPELARSELWGRLSDFYKLDLMDSILTVWEGEDETFIWRSLELTKAQQDDARRLVLERQERRDKEIRAEEKASRKLRDRLKDAGMTLTPEDMQVMLEATLYKNSDNRDHPVFNREDRENAKQYLRLCRLDERVLDDPEMFIPTYVQPPKHSELEMQDHSAPAQASNQRSAPATKPAAKRPVGRPRKDAQTDTSGSSSPQPSDGPSARKTSLPIPQTSQRAGQSISDDTAPGTGQGGPSNGVAKQDVPIQDQSFEQWAGVKYVPSDEYSNEMEGIFEKHDWYKDGPPPEPQPRPLANADYVMGARGMAVADKPFDPVKKAP